MKYSPWYFKVPTTTIQLLQYYRLCFLCYTWHLHDYFVTTNLYLSVWVPLPFLTSPLIPLPSGNHQSVLSCLFISIVCIKSHLQERPTHRPSIFIKASPYTLPVPLPSSTHTVSWKNIWMISKHCPYAGTFFSKGKKNSSIKFLSVWAEATATSFRTTVLSPVVEPFPLDTALLSWRGRSRARIWAGSPSLQLPEASPVMRPGPAGHPRDVTTAPGLGRLSPTLPCGSLSEEICSMHGRVSPDVWPTESFLPWPQFSLSIKLDEQ